MNRNRRTNTKKKFLVTAVMAGVLFLMSSCSTGNGWTAIPLDDGPDSCYQISRYESGVFITKTSAEGIYCPVEVSAK